MRPPSSFSTSSASLSPQDQKLSHASRICSRKHEMKPTETGARPSSQCSEGHHCRGLLAKDVDGSYKGQLAVINKASRPAVLNLPSAGTLPYSSSCCGDPPPNHKIILLILHNCNFATVMNYNANIFGNSGLSKGLCPPE